MLRALTRRKNWTSISEGQNPLYTLIETYADALTDRSSLYDFAWLMLYKFTTSRDELNVYEIKSKIDTALRNPKKLADNYAESTGFVMLSAVLTWLNALEGANLTSISQWIDEVDKRNWYAWKSTLSLSAEFQAFCSICEFTKDVNPILRRLEREKPSEENIRPLLYYYFALSLSGSDEDEGKVESFVQNLVENFSGVVSNAIIEIDDVEYMAIYLYLLARTGQYSEFERIYPKFEEILSTELIKSDWIKKAIKSAQDIYLGRGDDDVIIIYPSEFNVITPKILYLSLIALHEAGYNKVVVAPSKLQRAIQKLRDEDLVAVKSNFVKWYNAYFVLGLILLPMTSALLVNLLANNPQLSLVSAILSEAVYIYIRYTHEKPEIIKI